MTKPSVTYRTKLSPITGEELQVKFLRDSSQGSLPCWRVERFAVVLDGCSNIFGEIRIERDCGTMLSGKAKRFREQSDVR